MAIRYAERSTGHIKTEATVAGTALFWLYHNPIGEVTMNTLIKRKFVTDVYGWYMKTGTSKNKINDFIRDYQIDTAQFQMTDFASFNDFFIRKLKPGIRKIDTSKYVVISPADAKCLAWSDLNKSSFIVKGIRFNLSDFLNNDSLAQVYQEGSLLIFRLAPVDYHRYHFPISGIVSPVHKISGYYYSVNPMALKKNIRIFLENKRQYQIIQSPYFGNVIMAEVGATMVGSMVTTFKEAKAIKGMENGYFEFGGSTVILIFEKGKIKIDNDLIKNTKKQLETHVIMGERIGILNQKAD